METALTIMAPLVLTALGFLTYKHPVLARKILTTVFILNMAVQLLSTSFEIGRNKGYHRADMIVLGNIPDTANKAARDRFISEINLRQSIEKEVRKAQEIDEETSNNIAAFSGVASVILLILYILTYQFQSLWEKNKDGTEANSK